MQADEQRREAEAVDEAHDPVDIIVLLNYLADDRVVQRGDASTESHHQSGDLLGHVDALLEKRDQARKHAAIRKAENGKSQMRDPDGTLDEKIDHHIGDEHHADVKIDHLACSRFH